VIVVNGERAEARPGATLAEVLRELLGLTVTARGVAIAVNGEVVPRTAWETFALPRDARVEVLAAMQGG
jgi:sulfur carrier protein